MENLNEKLLNACSSGVLSEVKNLIKQGVDIPYTDDMLETPLHAAALFLGSAI